jgi:hypothetical protein
VRHIDENSKSEGKHVPKLETDKKKRNIEQCKAENSNNSNLINKSYALFLPFDLVLEDIVVIGNCSILRFEPVGSTVSVGKTGVGQKLKIECKITHINV